ncbi:acyl-CoA dehydrogenase family protein [Pseudoalteromonas rubra]|uniref:Acyl-CoA dehydrogenase n=1 Tax=Pseudoalteromonas rubra TaxID=43658 RepID=A0A4V2E470_9GAMM|nr:acyl-CoA dehydrogenase family protein [Pseudoalteromonas rubra]RZM85204.1 acyl-CoA dehydrogenase [Pseudoalteromonas rubra]
MSNKFSLKATSETLRAFSETYVRPNVLARDKAQKLDIDILEQLASAGLLGLEVPEPYFTRDDNCLFDSALPFSGSVLTIQEISRVDPGVSVYLHVHNILFNKLLLQFGSEEQKHQWLPKVATDVTGAFAVTEPQAGSDLSLMTTSATKVEGGYEISGEKTWITNAKEAGVMVLIANVAQSCGREVATAFLLDTNLPGVTIGERLSKMSVRASSTCPVVLNKVFVSDSAVLGTPNQGVDIANYGLCVGRIGIAAQMLGLSEGALELATNYSNERHAFKDKIVNFQGVAFPLAQLSAEISVLKPFIYQAAKKIELGYSATQVMDDANKAKLLASQLAERASSCAVETLGGNGVAEQYAVEKLYRDAKVGKIYEGTVNILLRSIASRALCN